MSTLRGQTGAIYLGTPDPVLLERLQLALRRNGRALEVLATPGMLSESDLGELITGRLKSQRSMLVFLDQTVAGVSAQRLKSWLERKQPATFKQSHWIVLCQVPSREQLLRLAHSGIIEVLPRTAPESDISAAVERCEERESDPRRALADLVSVISGVQLDQSKNILIEKRLTRRMVDLGLKNVQDYLDWFNLNRERELPELLSQLTTHTTEFFRDTSHFDVLIDQCLPQWLAQNPGEKIRIWSAACSTGEEVYSIAIALLEGFRAHGLKNPDFEIVGTDIDNNSVQTAQRGIYSANSVEKISSGLRSRWFDQGTGELSRLYKIKDEVWKHCRFRIQNLNSEAWPDGPFHAIFARNVFIYFKKDEVHRICRRMSDLLKPTGRLMLGYSETIDRKETGLVGVGKAVYIPEKSKSNEPIGTRNTEGRPKRILIVDDSKTVRASLRKILSPQYGFAVVGEAENPLEAVELLKSREVDLMTLDLHMPKMDGIEYLERIQGSSHPPIVVISSVQRDEAVNVLKCLELGASDYIEKSGETPLDDRGVDIRRTLSTVLLEVKPGKIGRGGTGSVTPQIGPGIQWSPKPGKKDLILIGASTGGIEAIRSIVARLPASTPPILVVQHIPKLFSALFSNRLNDISRIKCVEAEDGMIARENTLYIAPGGLHLSVRESAAAGMLLQTHSSPPLHGCRPAVDHLFNSAAALLANSSNAGGLRISAALLTGMGRDGAHGLKMLHERGAYTITQDEDTCVVYGMPKAAVEIGASRLSAPLNSIAWHLFGGLEEASSSKGLRRKAA